MRLAHINTSFKNLWCLGKQRTWAVAGGGVHQGRFIFKDGRELLSDICLLRKGNNDKGIKGNEMGSIQ